LFNAIDAQYDFLNSFLSLGLDRFWRWRTAERSLEGGERSILDLGVGTGKSLRAFLNAHRFERAVGCDFAGQMLERARRRLGLAADLVACDFHSLPFLPRTFDLVTGSFILRSVQEMDRFLSEVKRVLHFGGKVVFLELTRPANRFVRRLCYEPYLKFYVPWMGRFFSRHQRAYRFLTESILTFPDSHELKERFEAAGFTGVSRVPLTFGVVTILSGRVPDASQ